MTVPRFRTLLALGIGGLSAASAGALFIVGKISGAALFVLTAFLWVYVGVEDFSDEISRLQDLVCEERREKVSREVRFETFGEEVEMQVVR